MSGADPGRGVTAGGVHGRRRRVAAALALVGLVAAGLAAPPAQEPARAVDAATGLVPPPAPVIDAAPRPDWPQPLGLPDLAAYVLVEAGTGQVLAARDADVRRPVASTVKVLTALTALARVDPGDEVTVGDEVLEAGGAGIGLEPGDTWTVHDLVTALIARSANDAAEAIAVHVAGDRASFLAMMEADAAALGVEGLRLVSVSGLDDRNLLSAQDLATLARAALDHETLRPMLDRWLVALPGIGAVQSRNELLDRYAGATGVKTGYTEAAGYSLVASAERGGRELVAVVLGAGADPARFQAATILLDLGFGAFRPTELGADLRFAVAGGTVALSVSPVTLTVPLGHRAELALTLPIRPPEEDLDVVVEVLDEPFAVLTAELDDAGAPPPVDGAARLGRAAVDGAYAALRAAAARGTLR